MIADITGAISNRSYKAVHTSKACGSPSVRTEELERRVWEEIERVIYDPGIIIKRLEERENEGRRMGYEGQISLIETQLKDLAHKRTKCEAAYQRDIYTLDEFKAKMKDIRAQTQPLETSRGKLEAQLAETNSIDDQKRIVLAALWRIRQAIEQAQQAGKSPDEILFILKRRIVAQIVEAVYVDTNKREFTIEGEIKGTYAIDTSDLQNNAESEVHSEIDPPQQHSQDDTKPGSPMSKGIDGQIGLVSAHIYTNPNQMSPLCSSVLSHSWWSRLETLGRAGSAAPSRSIDNLFGVVHLVNPAITIATESEANVALLCIGQCVRCQTGASAIAVFGCVPSNVRHMMFTSLAAHPTVVVKVEQAELIKSQLLSPLRSMLRLRSNWIKCPQSFIQ